MDFLFTEMSFAVNIFRDYMQEQKIYMLQSTEMDKIYNKTRYSDFCS